MEPRQLLAAAPLYVGATYLESDTGTDHQGDAFEITFEGGAPDTELTRLVIQGDQNEPGLGYGDMIFDTVQGGLGAGVAFPFTLVSFTTRDSLAAPPEVQATVADGNSQLVLDFHGFHAGDKLVLSIDVDEVQRFKPIWDLNQANENVDPIASGVEFAQSQLTASFSAPHYHDANSTSDFLDAYNPALAGTGLSLPRDEENGYPDRTAGAVGTVLQQPLPIAISGTVYLEQNLDLVRNSGEPGLPGVQLELWKREDQGPNFLATGFTTTTAADGHYAFGLDLNLSPGVYQVREVQPDGVFSVGAIRGTVDGQPAGATVAGNPDVLTDIEIPLGDQRGVDFDFAEARPARISGYVYHDRDNDGRRDAGEEGLPNVPLQIVPVTTLALQDTLSVITDASGFYQVSALTPGTYRIVEISDPPGFLDGLVSAGTVDGVPSGTSVHPGNRIESIFLGGGQSGIEYNFGELVPASLTGHVRLSDADGNCHVGDVDYPPVAGVTVQLLDSVGQTLATTTTDTLGAYRFGGLAPGTYGVAETTPADLLDGDEHVGRVNGQSDGRVTANDTIDGIVLASAQTGLEYDFCEYVPASLAGYVYHDRNNNGLRESGEAGIAGVQVSLLQADGSEVATAVTDQQGRYQFARRPAGVYVLVETQPADWVDGLDAAGTIDGATVGQPANPGDRIGDIRLRWGDQGVDYNFGELHYAVIEGSVHLTGPEGDCYTPGGSQPPVAGVAIVLQNDRGETVAQVTTDSQGRYRFDELLPGSYTVIEATPANLIDGEDHLGTVDGVTVGELAGNDILRGIAVTSGQQGLEYDFCEHLPVSLSGFVYHDRNNNGLREADEAGIAGVQVTLLEVGGSQVATTATDQQGRYQFGGRPAGVYVLVETQPADWVDGLDAAGTIGGVTVGQPANPGDRIGDIRLRWGDQGVNYNFGELQYAVIEGSVHLTGPEGDCYTPGGSQPPVVGVVIVLQNDRGETVAQVTTDSQGRYRFDELLPGSYTVIEATPANLIDGEDHLGTVDGVTVGALAGNDILRGIAVTSGQHGMEYDFCEHLPASLSGFVYHDANNNGVFEPSENPIANVEITLRDAVGKTVATARTKQDGSYGFSGLVADQYRLVETQPAGYLDGQDAAGTIAGRRLGAAVNPGDEIREIGLRWGEHGVQYDFGELLSGSIAGHVHTDLNGDCVFDADESPLSGVTIELRNGDNQLLATTQTDSQGHYQFDSLAPGTYLLKEQPPSGHFHGGQQAGSGGGDDSLEDIIRQIAVGSGRHLTDYDFCERPPGRLSGYVFQDGESIVMPDKTPPALLRPLRDGARAPGDKPLPGVVLELRDGNSGVPLSGDQLLPGLHPSGPVRTLTDENGYYEFRGLPSGRYAVYETQPAGYIDGLDTPGTTGGLALNSEDNISPSITQGWSDIPPSDAIIGIPLGVGTVSEENNFSEVLVDVEPSPPPPDFIPDPPPRVPPKPPSPFFLVAPAPVAPSMIYVPPPPAQTIVSYAPHGTIDFTWHLSVVDAGKPRGERESTLPEGLVWRAAMSVDANQWNARRMREGHWTLRTRINAEDGSGKVREFDFGLHGGIPVTGDWNGDGIDEIGIFYQGQWFLDLNGNGRWDDDDLWAHLGTEYDLPVTGDWNGDGKDDIGIFGPAWLGDPQALRVESGVPDLRNRTTPLWKPKNMPPQAEDATDGVRLLKRTAKGPLQADMIDHVFRYGVGVQIPVVGDWNGDGIKNIGVFLDGCWYLDMDGDGRWSEGDRIVEFGQAGDIPAVGDFSGQGVDQIGVYRNGTWIIDINHNYRMDAHDKVFELGGPGDIPVVGDWDGDGVDDLGVYRDSEPDTARQAKQASPAPAEIIQE